MNPNDYKIISVNKDNIENEHICCALGNSREDIERSSQKKTWMKKQYDEGYVFKKFDIRGKVLIEYVPAENAWAPIDAPGYMYIDCFWVSGKYKGHGFAGRLLEECEKDAKNMNGLVVLSSKKKMPFLADKKYFSKKGFEVCDTANPYFELLVKKYKDAELPEFKPIVKNPNCDIKEGLVFYYTNHCTYTENWAKRIDKYAREEKGLKSKLIKIDSKEQAQNAPSPFSTCSLFYNGEFLTHEIPIESKLDKLLASVS